MKKVLVAILAVFILAGCSLFTPYEVRYTVTGTGTSTVSGIIYVDEHAARYTATTALPWAISFDVPRREARYLSVSAWNDEATGTITCSIYVDGDMVDSETDGMNAWAQHYL